MAVSAFLIVVVFVLELIAFGLGIAAEQRRSKGTYKLENGWVSCYYTSDIATGLGTGALLFLLAGQAIITAATRCLCCGGSLKPGASRVFAIIFFLLNWFCFIIAAVCFLAGSVQNAKHTRYYTYYMSDSKKLTCEELRAGTFAAGVAFTFFTFIMSISYYLCYGKARQGSWKSGNNRMDAGVNMASYN